jgi:tetratricopeptide (TPR) repeat protein
LAREESREFFRFQGVLNRHFEGEETTLAELDEALVETGLRALPLILLNTNDHELAIADRAAAAGVQDPSIDYFRAARALSLRQYRDAVTDLERALSLDPGAIELAQYRIFALRMDGDERAAEAADALRSRTAAGSGLPGFWEWYSGVQASQ